MVLQHGLFSLQTMLEGPWLHKRLSQHPWYGLWMRVKGPHHYKVTTLGSCVKWPSDCAQPLLLSLLPIRKLCSLYKNIDNLNRRVSLGKINYVWDQTCIVHGLLTYDYFYFYFLRKFYFFPMLLINLENIESNQVAC